MILYYYLLLLFPLAWPTADLTGIDVTLADQIAKLGLAGFAVLCVIAFLRSWVHTDAELKRALDERNAWMTRSLETDKRLEGLAETLEPIVKFVLDEREKLIQQERDRQYRHNSSGSET